MLALSARPAAVSRSGQRQTVRRGCRISAAASSASEPVRVVITGGSKGLGLALASEFLKSVCPLPSFGVSCLNQSIWLRRRACSNKKNLLMMRKTRSSRRWRLCRALFEGGRQGERGSVAAPISAFIRARLRAPRGREQGKRRRRAHLFRPGEDGRRRRLDQQRGVERCSLHHTSAARAACQANSPRVACLPHFRWTRRRCPRCPAQPRPTPCTAPRPQATSTPRSWTPTRSCSRRSSARTPWARSSAAAPPRASCRSSRVAGARAPRPPASSPTPLASPPIGGRPTLTAARSFLSPR